MSRAVDLLTIKLQYRYVQQILGKMSLNNVLELKLSLAIIVLQLVKN